MDISQWGKSVRRTLSGVVTSLAGMLLLGSGAADAGTASIDGAVVVLADGFGGEDRLSGSCAGCTEYLWATVLEPVHSGSCSLYASDEPRVTDKELRTSNSFAIPANVSRANLTF